MKGWAKVAGGLATFVVVAAAGASLYWGALLPRKAAPRAGSFPVTPERLARGKYIFDVVANCNDCHSERDHTLFGGPVIATGKGRGNVMQEEGLPGRIAAPNISSDVETGIGSWTDGEKLRAIREGIDRNGRALFPLMPYANFKSMSDYDAESLVVFLDRLPPVKNSLPATQVNFPVSFLIRGAPEPVSNVQAPPRGRSVEYGRYLATIGSCMTCHTMADKGELKLDMLLAGGREFKTPHGTVVSTNLTPDPETGIGKWSEEYFQQRFMLQRTYLTNGSPMAGPQQFTVMPWLGLCQMDPRDLSALYLFLRTQPTISNKIEKRPLLAKLAAGGAQ